MGSEKACPTIFYEAAMDLRACGHGDDIMFEGEVSHMELAVSRLESKFELEVKYKLGPEAGDDKQGLLLNRAISWCQEGIYWEADPRQVELLVAELGLVDAKSAPTPGTKATAEEWLAARSLPKETETAFRRAAARQNYIAQDRPDLASRPKKLAGACRPRQTYI